MGLREWLGTPQKGSSNVAVATFDTRISTPRLPGSAAAAGQGACGAVLYGRAGLLIRQRSAAGQSGSIRDPRRARRSRLVALDTVAVMVVASSIGVGERLSPYQASVI
jgi:hypothetical protein